MGSQLLLTAATLALGWLLGCLSAGKCDAAKQ